MNSQDLLNHHQIICTNAHNLMSIKNHDYAGASGNTPFKNFESSEKLGLCKTEQGILIRMIDKVQRLNTFIESGELKVKEESVDDACIDIINYAVLLSAYIKQEKN